MGRLAPSLDPGTLPVRIARPEAWSDRGGRGYMLWRTSSASCGKLWNATMCTSLPSNRCTAPICAWQRRTALVASPHNSAQGEGAHDISLRRAVENCRRALTGEAPLHVIGFDERLM